MMYSFSVVAPDKPAPKLPMDESSKLIIYSNVVEVPGSDKMALYNKALDWCNGYFKNPADVIRERDSVSGKIVCKARVKISNPADKKGLATDAGMLQYTLNLMFKDGRFKYDMTDFNWKSTSYFAAEKWMDKTSASYLPEYDYYLQQLNDKALEITKDLEKAMKSTAADKKKDW